MDNCVFCKIINKEYSSYCVYEDDDVMAFLDLSQVSKGHTLVVPKKHYKNFIECEKTIMNKVMLIAQSIAAACINQLNAKGVNIISNVNEAAGQSVMHFHVHVVPRYDENDGIKILHTDNSKLYSKDSMLVLAAILKEGISL